VSGWNDWVTPSVLTSADVRRAFDRIRNAPPIRPGDTLVPIPVGEWQRMDDAWAQFQAAAAVEALVRWGGR
jgi:hypothetical protein